MTSNVRIAPAALVRRSPVLGAVMVALLHSPFFFWLLSRDGAGPYGNLRSLAAALVLMLLVWARGRDTLEPRAPRRGLLGYGFWAAAGAAAIWGVVSPMAWWLSWPLFVMGMALHSRQARDWMVLVLLGTVVFPLEHVVASGIDPALQYLTALFASPLVNLTGLSVTVAPEHPGGPTLVGHQLLVTVTPLCAGSQTLLTLFTLGLVLAEVFLRPWETRLLFVVLAPSFGFLGNTLRVAVSTHAARLLGDGAAWHLAHDLIGYGTFAATYVLLFLVARRLRGASAHSPAG